MKALKHLKRQETLLQETLALLQKIEIKYVPSVHPLGTTDGQHYTVRPRR